MSWRVAKSLEVLRDQINQMAPTRSKDSDGTVGNAEHASRSSDHNPWVMDGKTGVVTAMDITNDPVHGVISEELAEKLRASRDKRIKYIISNRKICSSTTAPWLWRKYNGANPHNHHVHISVVSNKALYDDRDPWTLGEFVPDPQAPLPPHRPLLKRGSTGPDVVVVQDLLGITTDGEFGPRTEKAVRALQKDHKLVADGIVGTYTWEVLEKSA